VLVEWSLGAPKWNEEEQRVDTVYAFSDVPSMDKLLLCYGRNTYGYQDDDWVKESK
jgi:hypothetical protein